MPNWILFVTVLFAAAGALAVLVPAWLRLRAQRPTTPRPQRTKKTSRKHPVAPPALTLQCPICQGEVALTHADLRPLSPPEIALVVGQRKEAAGRPLSEANCPRCEACFTFLADLRPPRLLGTNIFHAQRQGNRCTDCGKPLKRPPWDPEEITSRDQVLDALDPLYGLDCDHCHAVCCVACCEEVSRNRSTDNTLMCPRCRHRPIHTLHYF